MDKLLPFYERELAFLRQYVRDFAKAYPRIAARMMLLSDISEDAQIERLIQTMAFTLAPVSQRIEDAYSEFTEPLLGVLYPHYLRPFPPCSIARLHLDSGQAAKLTAPVVIPRGQGLASPPVKGVPVRFSTVFDVTLSPLQLTAARFHGVAQAPRTLRLPPEASAQISLDLAIASTHASLGALKLESLRFFTDGDPALTAALRDVLATRVLSLYVEPAQSGRWIELDPEPSPLSFPGLAPEHSLIPFENREHEAYRLLTEYFAFPDKFGFVDLDVRQAGRLGGRQFTLHLILRDVGADSAIARLLEPLSADNLPLGCTPVINLFEVPAPAIVMKDAHPPYPLLAHAARPHGFEIYAIDAVTRTQKTAQGDVTTEFPPFYALRHSERLGRKEQYWTAHRDELAAGQSPGHEWTLTIVNGECEPVTPLATSLQVQLRCTQRELADYVGYRSPHGDLSMDGGSVASSISLLRKPTRAMRFERGNGALWRLISQLTLNRYSLMDGIEPLREMLKLYDLPRSAISTRQIESVVGITLHDTSAWLPQTPTPMVVYGTDIHLTIDEDGFATSSLYVFARVLEAFFAMYATPNEYIRLTLLSKASGKALFKCAHRRGDAPLV